MTKKYRSSLCWIRRDLRLADHAALSHALHASEQVLVVFVFDETILAPLRIKNKADRRVELIWEHVQALRQTVQAQGSDLLILRGKAVDLIPSLVKTYGLEAVFLNHDYEPAAQIRDQMVRQALENLHCAVHDFKDQVIFEGNEIVSKQAKPFSVFTPYKKAWLAHFMEDMAEPYPSSHVLQYLMPIHEIQKKQEQFSECIQIFEQLDFERTDLSTLGYLYGEQGALKMLERFLPTLNFYHEERDYPARRGTSQLSPHLRFGTISIRTLVKKAWHRLQEGKTEGAQTWLSELIWRDFFSMILFHFPHVVENAFRPEFDHLAFPNRLDYFQAWCEGRTGYPIVDAAMRQLNQTGWMHNRLRMIVASFLVKDLHIDWRWGEAYFAEKLIDFDLASNNGGWQWAASTGCDAQPYFRIFNPILQSKKFDPDGQFIRQFVPELKHYDREMIHTPWLEPLLLPNTYPLPLVDHAKARDITLSLFEAAKNQPK